LEGIAIHECSLERMQDAVSSYSLDRGNFSSVPGDRQYKARVHANTIYQHGASTALAVVASLFRSGQLEVFSEKVEKRDPRRYHQLVAGSVEDERNGNTGCR